MISDPEFCGNSTFSQNCIINIMILSSSEVMVIMKRNLYVLLVVFPALLIFGPMGIAASFVERVARKVRHKCIRIMQRTLKGAPNA